MKRTMFAGLILTLLSSVFLISCAPKNEAKPVTPNPGTITPSPTPNPNGSGSSNPPAPTPIKPTPTKPTTTTPTLTQKQKDLLALFEIFKKGKTPTTKTIQIGMTRAQLTSVLGPGDEMETIHEYPDKNLIFGIWNGNIIFIDEMNPDYQKYTYSEITKTLGKPSKSGADSDGKYAIYKTSKYEIKFYVNSSSKWNRILIKDLKAPTSSGNAG